jgi:hypothetical protein
MPTQVTTITAAETRKRKADLKSRLKETSGVSNQREELHIDYVADPLDQVRSSTDRDVAVQRLDHQARLIYVFNPLSPKSKMARTAFVKDARSQFLESGWMRSHGPAYVFAASRLRKPPRTAGSRLSKMQPKSVAGYGTPLRLLAQIDEHATQGSHLKPFPWRRLASAPSLQTRPTGYEVPRQKDPQKETP